jgi:hypothetical protein
MFSQAAGMLFYKPVIMYVTILVHKHIISVPEFTAFLFFLILAALNKHCRQEKEIKLKRFELQTP